MSWQRSMGSSIRPPGRLSWRDAASTDGKRRFLLDQPALDPAGDARGQGALEVGVAADRVPVAARPLPAAGAAALLLPGARRGAVVDRIGDPPLRQGEALDAHLWLHRIETASQIRKLEAQATADRGQRALGRILRRAQFTVPDLEKLRRDFRLGRQESAAVGGECGCRSEEHTSELQSCEILVCY